MGRGGLERRPVMPTHVGASPVDIIDADPPVLLVGEHAFLVHPVPYVTPRPRPSVLLTPSVPHAAFCMALLEAERELRVCRCAAADCPYAALGQMLNTPGARSAVLRSVSPERIEVAVYEPERLLVSRYGGRAHLVALMPSGDNSAVSMAYGALIAADGLTQRAEAIFYGPVCPVCDRPGCGLAHLALESLGSMRYAGYTRTSQPSPRDLSALLMSPRPGGPSIETRAEALNSTGGALLVTHSVEGLPVLEVTLVLRGADGRTCSVCGPRPCPHDTLFERSAGT